MSQTVKLTERAIERAAGILSELERHSQTNADLPTTEETRQLLRGFLALQLLASKPGGRVVRRFLNATRFDSVLGALHALSREQAEDRAARNDRFITMLAAIFIFPSLALGLFGATDGFILKNAGRFWKELQEPSVSLWTIDISQYWSGILLASLALLLIGTLSLFGGMFTARILSNRRK